jgi:DNA-binding transcriptional LysR family regulator
MENFSGLRVFAQAAETLSFVEAGRRLGLSASAVGKAVSRLEQRLGARLFHRSTHHVRLTTEGALFLERCRRILDELDRAGREIADARKAVRGPLRVSLPSWATTIMPVFRRFLQVYPEVRLELDLTDRLVDVIAEGYDLVIRTGQAQDSRLMTRLLGRFRHAIVAAPAYVAGHGLPREPEDLREHLCLHGRHPQTGGIEPWPLVRDGVDLDLDLPVTAIVNSAEARLALAEDGAGVACVPASLAARPFAEGRLIALLSDRVRDAGELRLLWPVGEQHSVRALVDFIVQSASSPTF